MNLLIFNPEHDLALAANLSRFTAPHAGRSLRHDLGYLPMVSARPEDWVLVDDEDAAREALRHLPFKPEGRLVSRDEFARLMSHLDHDEPLKIQPWGWDLSLRQNLIDLNVPTKSLPSIARLNRWRLMSHRAWAATHLLDPLQGQAGVVGESYQLTRYNQLKGLLVRLGQAVAKAPWSSSGRGIRYLDAANMTPQQWGWLNNVISRQGSVMIEPYYNKVLDFGMEFKADSTGRMSMCGLSLFGTHKGAYTGNIIDSEEEKWSILAQYVDTSLVKSIRDRLLFLLEKELKGIYIGCLGVDMMVVRTPQGNAVHPCVELNLRITMGHIALQLYERLPHKPYLMSISLKDKYRMLIREKSMGIDEDHEGAERDGHDAKGDKEDL